MKLAMPGQKVVRTVPKTAEAEPVKAAPQAAGVVPLRQYSPPMIAAPAPAVNMAPVRFHHRLMYSVGVKTVLKRKAKAATPVTARRSIQMCCLGDIAVLRIGRITS